MNRPIRWSRQALDDIKEQVQFIAEDNPGTARRVADRLRDTGVALGVKLTGRPGRVTGSYEKSVTGLPYTIAYAQSERAGREGVVFLRMIHVARDWPAEGWSE